MWILVTIVFAFILMCMKSHYQDQADNAIRRAERAEYEIKKYKEEKSTEEPQNTTYTQPQRRLQGNKKAFVAIDFEYLYHSRYDTPCAIGMVKVIDNVITEKFYTLIHQPKLDAKLAPNNGITPEMLVDAPPYSNVYEYMVTFTEGLAIVAHNAGTEKKILRETPHPSHLPSLAEYNFIDTDALSGHRSLPTLCEEYGIPLNHHNALSDAEACAEVYLRLCGTQSVKEVVRKIHDTGKYASMHTEDRGDKDAYGSLPKEEWLDNNSPFKGKHVCVTGKFLHYPDRDSLRIELKRLGAHISKNVAKSTNILLCGSLESAGPSKVEKIQAQGGIILFEEDVIPWVAEQI